MNIQFFNPPVFHYSGVHYRMLPTISLPTLVAWCNQRGHHAEAVDLEALRVSPEQFLARFSEQKGAWPDVIGVTGLTITRKGMSEIIRAIREAGFKGHLVAGGVYMTLKPHEGLEWGADLVVTGECEGNLLDLLSARATGIHAGVPAPIEDIPCPDWRYWTPAINTYDSNLPTLLCPNPGISMWTRGCPFRCIFCSNIVFGGRRTRYRPPYMVEADMLQLKMLGSERVYVYDDELVGTKSPDGWMSEVADRIQPLGMSWVTQGRCSRKQITPELMADCKRAGCHTIFWGLETFSPRLLKVMKKGIMPEDIMHTLRVSRAAGINNAVFTMIGNYTETDEDREMTCQGLAQAYAEGLIQMRQTTICTPMPGTKMAEYARAEGWYTEAPDFGPQMLQHMPTPWLSGDRAEYWMKRYHDACPVWVV